MNFLLKTDLDDTPASDLAVDITGPTDLSPLPTVKSGLRGMYAINFIPEEVGNYLVHVTHNDAPVNRSPFRITAQQIKAVPAKCFIVSEDLSLFETAQPFGRPSKFRVSTAGAGHGTLNITSHGPGDAGVKIVNEGEGMYSCEFTPLVVGRYNVDITWDDQPIPHSPYQLTFQRRKQGLIKGLNLKSEDFQVGVPHRFKLHCAEVGTGVLEVKSIPSGAARVSITPAGNDVYHIQMVPVEKGLHEVSVQYNGIHIAGSPFKLTLDRPSKDESKDTPN